MSKILGIQEPPDGFTPEEEEIARLISEYTVQDIYEKMPTARMKAIVALHFELGYTQEVLATIFHTTQERIAYDIDMIRKVLCGGKYRPQKAPKTVRVEDMFKLLMLLRDQ